MEHKFRGERTDTKEWIRGSLINNVFQKSATGENCYYIIPNHEDYNYLDTDCWADIAEFIDDFEVIPETVGMFTFKKDMNKTDVYVGDKLIDGFGILYEVVWSDKLNGFGLLVEGSDNYPASFTCRNMAVIGTIHDTPETKGRGQSQGC